MNFRNNPAMASPEMDRRLNHQAPLEQNCDSFPQYLDAELQPNDSLLQCLRWDATGNTALAALGENDWPVLMQRLRQKRGHAFLDSRLRRSGAGVVPPGWVTEELRHNARAAVARVLRTLAELDLCLRATGTDALALKGLDLAHRVYAHPGLRPMGDFDILVDPEKVAALDQFLISRGYTPDGAPNAATMNDPWRHHIRYAPGENGVMPIEVHWRLSTHVREAGALDGLRARALPLTNTAKPLPLQAMAPEDLLLHLCEHIVHHAFETPLTQLWDLAEVTAWAGEGFDWPTFWRRAAAAGLARGAILCFERLEAELGVHCEAAFQHSPVPPPPPAVTAAVPDMLNQLGCFPLRGGGHTVRLTAALANANNFSARIDIARRALFPPPGTPSVDDQSNEAPRTALGHWGALWRRKRRFLWEWLSGRGDARRAVKRRILLLTWLKGWE